MENIVQFGRSAKLLVYNQAGDALDLSEFRIKFGIKRSDTMTPNIADIRIYNVTRETTQRVNQEFNRVILQAGYKGNEGVIFRGNIKQAYYGRENQTDTFLDIVAGDGDFGYNFAIVSKSIAAGATYRDVLDEAVKPMLAFGLSTGYIGDMQPYKFPRGKVLYGMSRDILNEVAFNNAMNWSIQDEQITFIPKKSYLPGEAVVITAKTGIIGIPEQTTYGVNVKCLLNPRIKIGNRVQIDNESVQRLKIDLSQPLSPENIPAPLTSDGVYYPLVIEHQGDNWGNDWTTSLTCLNINVTTNPENAVIIGG